jgi:putative hydrolase of the HAD superfamily
MDKIDAIIFDLGGVFIHIDYKATIDAFEKLGFHQAHHLYSQSEQSFLFQQYEIGEISTQHFINKLLELSNRVITPNQVVHAWNAMIGEIELNSLNVLKVLQGKTRLFMLSNTNELHMEIVKKKWHSADSNPIDFYFEKIYVSHQLGMRKPHKETFEVICQMNDLNPKTTLFIDDSIQHIEGALKAGMQVSHLTNIFNLQESISSVELK